VVDETNQPRPVPSLVAEPGVTDEDRNRYGHLLDRAAERGLIGPSDYEVRLRDLAEATTIEELNRIVTELPAFGPAPATAPRSGSRAGAGRALGSGGVGVPVRSRRRSSPWLLLVIVVAIMAASLVLLAIFAEHFARTRNSGLPSVTAVGAVSALRL
jgi:hypothetical protein